ncbi:MAG: hypothetical protein HY821_13285 [Acidobacteria bacterium]|nr:hypothetical protein [Acidobacteriota bacterium]
MSNLANRLLLSASTLLLAAGLEAQPPGGLPVISGNGFVYAMVAPNGGVKVWGRSKPKLGFGDGNTAAEVVWDDPRPVPGLGPAMSVSVGPGQALVLLADGTVAGWGGNSDCEVGNGEPGRKMRRGMPLAAAPAPVPVTGLRNAVQVAAGSGVSGAVLADGSVWVWGAPDKGLLANGLEGGGYPCVAVPQPVEGLTGVVQLAFSETHALALKQDGTIMAWGANREGQIGDGTREPRFRPVQVQGISNAISVGAGYYMSAALLKDGTVRTWGMNLNGRMGDPSTNPPDEAQRYKTTPYAVPGVTGVRALQANSGFVLIQGPDGTLRGWGESYHGSLGIGVLDNFFGRPQAVKGLGPVARFYSMRQTVFAVRADGAVFGWGPIQMNTAQGRVSTTGVPVRLF